VSPLFHIVLHEPEIPNNTGNIGRTCIATGCSLHLIRPLGFDTSEKACRRAGLDYWPRLRPSEYESWSDFLDRAGLASLWLFSTKARTPAWEAPIRRADHLVFGKETAGLPDHILAAYPQRTLTLPLVPHERSLNLATAVCAVVYIGIERLTRAGELALSPDGRLIIPALDPPR
jgi:tRNA (cytidine/uridine-2'-O-)-methyltransferase